MIGIPYIQSLFGAILDQSKVIEGRFFTCPFWGNEINKINIAEIVEFVKEKLVTDQKYPVALLMPIKTTGNFQFSGLDDNGVNAYNNKEINIVFLAQPYATGQNQNYGSTPNNQPQHTIPETWHDMERCAIDFMAVLYKVISNSELQGTLYISEKEPQHIFQLTGKGNDKAAGVMLRFYLGWNTGCDIEDYKPDFLDNIIVPPITDTHPSHSM